MLFVECTGRTWIVWSRSSITSIQTTSSDIVYGLPLAIEITSSPPWRSEIRILPSQKNSRKPGERKTTELGETVRSPLAQVGRHDTRSGCFAAAAQTSVLEVSFCARYSQRLRSCFYRPIISIHHSMLQLFRATHVTTRGIQKQTLLQSRPSWASRCLIFPYHNH